ncbi:MAG: helix-turn-helix domain-containing protein [Phycisphaeraceae bacterium]|nr:helix-turn-helix domain-containing protein [Phycisphaerales bacterium]MCB9842349.1 helix-turn-helix domain-containing protein [Phycisphaeraceae bacterium]
MRHITEAMDRSDAGSTIPRLLDAGQVGHALRVHRNTVHRECAEGRLGHLRIGRRVLFTEAHIRDYLATRERKGGACSTNRSGTTRGTCLSGAPTAPTISFTGPQRNEGFELDAQDARARAQVILRQPSGP